MLLSESLSMIIELSLILTEKQQMLEEKKIKLEESTLQCEVIDNDAKVEGCSLKALNEQ